MRLILIFSVTLLCSSCANFGRKLKAFFGGKPAPIEAEKGKSNFTTYSKNQNFSGMPRRQYKRMTRSRMEEEALLAANTGSLWVMEGQGAYLFSQNIVRMVGDPIGVVIEGEPREQLQAKVDVISDLIQRLEARAKARLRGPASTTQKAGAQDQEAKPAKTAQKTTDGKEKDFSVKTVPTRVLERTVDGNYRVKGAQPFMIGSREYQVIVTGIVRAEDFNEEGISASKLLDPKFDVISYRRKEGES